MIFAEVDAQFARALAAARQSFLNDPPGRQVFTGARLELDPALLGMPARVSVSFDLQAKPLGHGPKSALRFYGSCSTRLENVDDPVPCQQGWAQAEAYMSFDCKSGDAARSEEGREAFDAALAKAIALLPDSQTYRVAREAFDIGQSALAQASRRAARL